MNSPAPKRGQRAADEPELTQEESVPTDGRDTQGEEMMKQVRNDKLQEPGDREGKTPAKS